MISEIFPNRHRAEGQALGSFTHWLFAALLTTFLPTMVTAFAPGTVGAVRIHRVSLLTLAIRHGTKQD
ncbi:MAG: MFS transporter, partial [Paludibaculum sp.]